MKTVTFDESQWKLVPVEPTFEMCDADAGTSTTERRMWNAAHYRAMLAAAPQRPTSPSATTLRNEGIEMAARWHDEKVQTAKEYCKILPKRFPGRVPNPEWEAWSDTMINHTDHAAAIRALKETRDE
jgi:hypothetical protein